MNLLHLKYAVEIARTNSINKAAETLYVGQSALSRAVKELENGLGITIFERSAKGMFLTPDGEVFVRQAKNVLEQADSLEKMFSEGAVGKKRFSVSVPRADYIIKAFTDFSNMIGRNMHTEMFYKETNSMRTVKNVLSDDYKLGIIRYAEHFDRYYKEMLEDKGLEYELVAQFCYMLVTSADSPVASLEKVTQEELGSLMEIAHGDPYVPSLPAAEVRKEELGEDRQRRIFVFDRESQFELLSGNTDTYMWMSPLPKATLERFGLVQRECGDKHRVYKDVLIHRKDYALTELDNMFISRLIASKREVMG